MPGRCTSTKQSVCPLGVVLRVYVHLLTSLYAPQGSYGGYLYIYLPICSSPRGRMAVTSTFTNQPVCPPGVIWRVNIHLLTGLCVPWGRKSGGCALTNESICPSGVIWRVCVHLCCQE